MQQYAQKRKQAGPAPAAYRPRSAEQLPNSVRMAMAETIPSEESVYADALKAKFMEHQLPSAEREADRIASGIHASTPEQVKAQLGEKMGADFSSVRFHTDGAAAGQAEQMGARAFTTGRDVYFGQGGFDAATAAHELVHTVQQGSVAADMSTLSAPAGEVQMKPEIQMGKRNWLRRAGAWIWDKTGAKLARSNRAAFDDIMKHKQDKSYYKLGFVDKALNFIKNPIALMRSWANDKEEWKTGYDERKGRENALIAEYQRMNNVHALDHSNYHWGETLEGAPETVGEAEKGNLPEERGIGSLWGSPVRAINDLKNANKTGIVDEQVKAGAGVASSAATTLGYAGMLSSMAADKIGGLPGAVKGAMNWSKMGLGEGIDFFKPGGGGVLQKLSPTSNLNVGNALGMLSGAIQMGQGAFDIDSGTTTKRELNGVDKQIGDELEGAPAEALGKLSQQARRQASHRQIQGAVNLTKGAMNTAASLMTGPTGLVAKGVSVLGGLAGDEVVKAHQSSMDDAVLNEDMAGLDDQIEEYAAKLALKEGITDLESIGAVKQKELRRQAKHIILKAHGFNTGKRKEAVAFFNTARAKYLTQRGNRGKEGDKGDSIAKSMLRAMGVYKREDGKYNEDDVASRLGRAKTQEEILNNNRSGLDVALEEQERDKNKGFWQKRKENLKSFAKFIFN